MPPEVIVRPQLYSAHGDTIECVTWTFLSHSLGLRNLGNVATKQILTKFG